MSSCRSANPLRILLFLTLLPAVVVLCAPVMATAQQPTSPLAITTAPRKTVKRVASANVRRGSIDSIDAALGKLTLKSAAGIGADYELTDKTHYWRARHAVDAAAFKSGDGVVVHLRHSRKMDRLQVVELDDRASWDWLDAVRHRTMPAIITALGDDTLSVSVGADRIPFTYALNANTLWSRGDKAVQPAAYKAGDRIYIVPRALPGGDIQARAVSDSLPAAALLKERASASVRGTVHGLDSAAHTLTLTTPNHDLRLLACAPELEVTRGGKPLTWAALKVGQSVTARLRRNEEQQQTVWRITIAAVGTKASVRKKPILPRFTNKKR